MSANEFVHAEWAASAYEWNPVTMEAYDTRQTGKRRKAGSSQCQAPGCTVDLSGSKPYFKRHCICATHMKAPQIWIDGEKKRYCQQCGHFERLDLFVGANRSCKMSLERRSAIAQASKQRGGRRSGKARDQRMAEQSNTTTSGDNTSGNSDKADGFGAKDSAWGSSPTPPARELLRSDSEADKRAGLMVGCSGGGGQSSPGPRDVDMAADSCADTIIGQQQHHQQQQLFQQQQDPFQGPAIMRLPGPSRTASTANRIDELSVLNRRSSYTVHDHVTHNHHPTSSGANLHATAIPNSKDPQLPSRDARTTSVSPLLLGSGGSIDLNLSMQPPPPPPPPNGNGGPGVEMRDGGGSIVRVLGAMAAPPPPALAQPFMRPELRTRPPFGPLWEQRMSAGSVGGAAAIVNPRLPYGSGHAALSGSAPQVRLLAGAALPPRVFSAAPPSALMSALGSGGGGSGGAHRNGLLSIHDPGLEMQLQDIVDSARLEGQGWFSGPMAIAAAPPGRALLDPAAAAPSGSPLDTEMQYTGSTATAPAAAAAAPLKHTANDAYPVCPSEMDAAGGTAAGGGDGCSSLLTCMQYLHQHQSAQQAQMQQPYNMYGGGFGGNGVFGGAAAGQAFGIGPGAPMGGGLGAMALGLGRGSARDLLSYRPGEPDQLVRMALKLTSRSPDELDPSTIAALRKMLSVYDRLQSMQGYVRPGCTQLLIDAHRTLGAANEPPAAAAATATATTGAGYATVDVSPYNSGGSASTAACASAAAGGLGSSTGSSTSGGSSVWWPDDASSSSYSLSRAGGGPPSGCRSGAASLPVSQRSVTQSLGGLRLLEAAAAAVAATAAAGSGNAGGGGASGGGLFDAESLLRDPAVLAVLRDIAVGNESALTMQLEDVSISVGADGSLGEARKLTELPNILAASCAAVSADSLNVDITLYGTHLNRQGVTIWARMHGVCHQLLSCRSRGGGAGLRVRLPPLQQLGLLQLEAVAPGGVAVGAPYPLLVLPSFAAVSEVHGVAAAMGPASLRRFITDFGLVLGVNVLLQQPLNGIMPVNGSLTASTAVVTAEAADGGAAADGNRSGTWGSTESASGSNEDTGLGTVNAAAAAATVLAEAQLPEAPAVNAPTTSASSSSSLASAASSRRRLGLMSRCSSWLVSPGSSGEGGGGLMAGAADPTEAMSNADDEEVVELLLNAAAVRSMLERSLALLQAFVERRLPACVMLLVARLAELHERFPDRMHAGLAPPGPSSTPSASPAAAAPYAGPSDARFGLMHSAARQGDVHLMGNLMALEGLLGEHCSLTSRGPNGVTPLHLLALLPQAPWLLRSLQRLYPGLEQALLNTAADDGVTPLQLYQFLHRGGAGGAGAGVPPGMAPGTEAGMASARAAVQRAPGAGSSPQAPATAASGSGGGGPPPVRHATGNGGGAGRDDRMLPTFRSVAAAPSPSSPPSAEAAAAAVSPSAMSPAVPADMLLAAAAAEAEATGAATPDGDEAWSARGDDTGPDSQRGSEDGAPPPPPAEAEAERPLMGVPASAAASEPPPALLDDAPAPADRLGGKEAEAAFSAAETQGQTPQPNYSTAPASTAVAMLGCGGSRGDTTATKPVPLARTAGCAPTARLVPVNSAAEATPYTEGAAAAAAAGQKGPVEGAPRQPSSSPGATSPPHPAAEGTTNRDSGTRNVAAAAAAVDVQSEAWSAQGEAAAAAAARTRGRADGGGGQLLPWVVRHPQSHPVGTRISRIAAEEQAAIIASYDATADGDADASLEWPDCSEDGSACLGSRSSDFGNSSSTNRSMRAAILALAAAVTAAGNSGGGGGAVDCNADFCGSLARPTSSSPPQRLGPLPQWAEGTDATAEYGCVSGSGGGGGAMTHMTAALPDVPDHEAASDGCSGTAGQTRSIPKCAAAGSAVVAATAGGPVDGAQLSAAPTTTRDVVGSAAPSAPWPTRVDAAASPSGLLHSPLLRSLLAACVPLLVVGRLVWSRALGIRGPGGEDDGLLHGTALGTLALAACAFPPLLLLLLPQPPRRQT